MRKLFILLVVILFSVINVNAADKKAVDACINFTKTTYIDLMTQYIKDYRKYLYESIGFISTVPIYKDLGVILDNTKKDDLKIDIGDKYSSDIDLWLCCVDFHIGRFVKMLPTYKECVNEAGRSCEIATEKWLRGQTGLHFCGYVDMKGNPGTGHYDYFEW